jgi:predicted transcriptional regulator
MSTTLSVRISEELKEKLDILSQATNRTKSYLAGKALEDYVKRNTWKTKELTEALKEVEKGIFVSNNTVNEWLNSWGTDKERLPPKPDILPK